MQVLWHFYHQLVGDVYAFAFPVPHAEAVVGDYRVDVIFLDYFGRFFMFSPYLIQEFWNLAQHRSGLGIAG